MKSLNRNTLAIYVATLFSYQMYIASSLLASVQAWFPTVDSNLIVLFFSAPLLANAFMALALSPAIGRINKKLLVVIGLATIIAGGTLVVLLGGNSFAISLIGVIMCGLGNAATIAATNTLLVEMNPATASTTVATNNAVGCLGSMILTAVAGVLASDGTWTRAYMLCFPCIITLALFLILYRGSKVTVAAVESAVDTQPTTPNKTRNVGLFSTVVFVFLLANFAAAAWNSNYSIYIMMEKGIGNTVQTGMMNTLSSLGGVLGGFLIAGIVIRKLKRWTVPVSVVLVATPCLAAAFGCTSIPVLYVCAFMFMMFYQPVYGEMSASAGKLFPGGGGISCITAMGGLGNFIGPYLVNFIGTFGDGTTRIKFWAGVVFVILAALIAIPTMKKVQNAD